MPTVRRPGKRTLYVELPEELWERLNTLAETNRRKITAEVVLALEAHLAASTPVEAPKKRGTK